MIARVLKLVVASFVVTLCFSTTQAVPFTFTGNTTGGSTFNRLVVVPLPPVLSPVGTAVPYSVFQFGVSVSGSYTFLSTSLTPGYDPFLLLYANQFNPSTPLTNFLIANDDLVLNNFTQSGFVFSLSSGANYLLVQSGFNNLDFGAFTTTIDGPGTIIPVPEPATMFLFGAGLAGVAVAMRKQRTANKSDQA